jgi:signal transduction histidine kinase
LNLFDRPYQLHPPAGEQIQLSYQDNFISFEFAALDYTVPEKNQYAYMLEGLDEDWVQAGTRRYANYPNLRPGDYVFRVRGSNNDGIWNEEGAWVRVTIEPPIWETWPFRILIVASLMLVGLFAYRQRVRRVVMQSRELESQVQERTAELVQTNLLLEQEIGERQRAEEALAQKAAEEAVAAERGRLARELHDAVTQTLFSASLIAEALPQLWEMDQQEGRQLLSKLRQLSRGALSEMRALLLELRPAALLDTDLADLLRQLGDAAAGRSGVSVKLTTKGEGDLPAEVHIALYRIAQEALNNVVKHARASQVDINLSRFGDESGRVERVELSIGDDGGGFDPASVAADHLGISIMHERAAAIGATLKVDSEIGRGATVRVVWKAEKAAEGASDE